LVKISVAVLTADTVDCMYHTLPFWVGCAMAHNRAANAEWLPCAYHSALVIWD
jgi:hypothetical protein